MPYFGYPSVHVGILRALAEKPRPTRSLQEALDVQDLKAKQSLSVRLSQMRRDGYIELKFVRPCNLDPKQVEAERELSGSKPKGRAEWWEWHLTFQGRLALEVRQFVLDERS